MLTADVHEEQMNKFANFVLDFLCGAHTHRHLSHINKSIRLSKRILAIEH